MRALTAFVAALVVVLLLRSTALSAFASRGIVLDALAFATVVWSLRHGPAWGASFGFALGIAADLDAAHWLGRHALVLTLLGYAIGRLASTLVRESARTQFALLIAATLIHQTWCALFELTSWSASPYLALRTVLSTVASAAIGTLLLAVARRLAGGPLFGNVSIQPGQTR
ncbi:MAG TPA: rod shape-determining protein MreD [Dongiaceae bacterium]|nr:rod shape-determining protein MreD [Dongiaceae bacterium]